MNTVLDPFLIAVSNFHELFDMQATMMQPVGGMDRIAIALEAALPSGILRKNSEVIEIAKTSRSDRNGVAVSYRDQTSGDGRVIHADYCICTLPLKVLADVKTNLTADRKSAISRAAYANGIKVAFQSPRFWELDNQIYGGLSFTDRDTFVTWYPSSGLGTAQGVLVASYAFGGPADRLGRLPLAERVAYARGTIERLHPGRSQLMTDPISIEWSKVRHNLGMACALDEQDPAAYALLNQPDGPIYLAGEHLSHVSGWQQGAIVSAQRVAVLLDARHRQGRPVDAIRSQ